MAADRWFVISEGAIRRVDEAAGRLFTENRMTADDMRDMAQSLKSVINDIIEVNPQQVEALFKK